jgi:hypothetical protein
LGAGVVVVTIREPNDVARVALSTLDVPDEVGELPPAASR